MHKFSCLILQDCVQREAGKRIAQSTLAYSGKGKSGDEFDKNRIPRTIKHGKPLTKQAKDNSIFHIDKLDTVSQAAGTCHRLARHCQRMGKSL